MKNPLFSISASIFVVLSVLCSTPAPGGESLWDGSLWNVGHAGDDTTGWGDDEPGTTWGDGGGSGGGDAALPPLPPALEHFRADAEKGDAWTLCEIALAYHRGSHGLAVDYHAALRWYEIAAAKGSVPAMGNLSAILMDNLIESDSAEHQRNKVRAYHIMRQAAEAGNVTAQLNMGKFLQLGKGVEANEDEAVVWLEKAGMQGDPGACDRLSLIYHNRGDMARAAEWFRRGAEAGHPQATFNLGVYYESGLGGLPEDQAKAFSLFLKSARLGHSSGMLVAGRRYLEGRGCRVDPSRAKKWLLQAKANGESDADELLATIPSDIQPLDDRPLRVTAAKMIGDFANDAEAATHEYEDRTVDLSGGNTSVNMNNDKTTVLVKVPGSSLAIECDVPPDGSGSAVFNYGAGMVLRARFAGFSPEAKLIRLESGRTIPEK